MRWKFFFMPLLSGSSEKSTSFSTNTCTHARVRPDLSTRAHTCRAWESTALQAQARATGRSQTRASRRACGRAAERQSARARGREGARRTCFSSSDHTLT